MAHGKTDQEHIATTRNTARFFVELRQISWVLLFGTLAWGSFGYLKMPKRKDPDIPVRIAVAVTPWPGASAERVEQLVTRKVEEKIAQNARVTEIKSISRTSLSVVYLELDQEVKSTGEPLNDISLKLDTIHDLPQGAGPVQFIKDFGDTAALMLTVASPKVSDIEIAIRAQAIRPAIEKVRKEAGDKSRARATVVLNHPVSIDPRLIRRSVDMSIPWARAKGSIADIRTFEGPGYNGIDFAAPATDETIRAYSGRS